MNDYPLPANALAVWYDGSGISVRLPPEPGKDRGHVIRVESDVDGLKNLLVILKSRAAGVRKFGTDGSPTQAQVNEWRLERLKMLKAHATAKARAETPKRHITLKELGI